MLSVWLLPLLISLACGHPQCLDYKPPFESKNQLSLCSEYQSFGCCNNDNAIKTQYDQIVQSLSAEHKAQCSEYIRAILCQKCSPYAAHLYFAESSLTPSTFPSLCTNYSNSFTTQCGHLLSLLTPSSTINPPDPNYCYPDTLTEEDKIVNLGESVLDGSCVQLCARRVITDLYSPTAAKPSNDGTHRIFVVEQRGVVWVYLSNFTRLSVPFINIRDQVRESGRRFDERGLLDIAFHPNYATNGLFYLFFTGTSSGQQVVRISEFRVSTNNMNKADLTSERVVIEIEQYAANHNGGSLLFREGYLYISLGDGGGANDPRGNGQNKTTLLGTMLRIDVDNYDDNSAYSIPKDNPFVNEPNARPEIYAYGLRNPWRCTLDRGDRVTGEGAGRIFCGDVGQNEIEEVDLITKGGNYGWNGYEGTSCFRNCERIVNPVMPIDEYNHTLGVSITGGYVYRGCESPNLNGKYIFGDWSTSRLFYLEMVNGTWRRTDICMGDESICVNDGLSNSYHRYINSFFEDELGEVYILSTTVPQSTSPAGAMFQLVEPSKRGNPSECTRRITTEVVVVEEPTVEARIYRGGRYGVARLRSPTGPWGILCPRRWTWREARVFCRNVPATSRGSYSRGVNLAYRRSYGSPRASPHFRLTRCTGRETSIMDCKHDGWSNERCPSQRPASVYCFGFRRGL